MKSAKIEVIIEITDHLFSARVEDKGKFPVANGYGKGLQEALKNLTDTIEDYKKHEGKKDRYWQKVDTKNIEWDFRFDIQAFFQQFNFLNQSKLANLFGINPGLMRQYASGVKFPSGDQVLKLENALKKLAGDLEAVRLYAA